MNFDLTFMLALLGAVFVLFVWGRWRYDVVAFGALLAATVAGLVPLDRAFAGFGHPATVTVAMVLIIGRALQNAGAVDLIAAYLLPPLRSASQHIAVVSAVAAALSTMINNVGALALLMPATIQSATRAKRSPAAILMPLSFGSILGGMVTLIGTPPNIIVATYRAEVAGAPFAMFDFTPVGGVVAVVGLAFVALIGWRLIPDSRRARLEPGELFQIEGYVSEATVPEDSPAVGLSLAELDDSAEAYDALILGLVRADRRIDRAGRRETVRAGDVLILEAAPDSLDTALAKLQLLKVGEDGDKPKRGVELSVAEAVVQPRAPVVRETAASLRLRRRFGVNLLAVSREGEPFRGRLRSFRFRPGDILLLEGEAERLPEIIGALGCLPLAPRGLTVGQPRRTGMAIGLFAAMIACASIGWLSMPVALALAAIGMIGLGIISPRDIYDSVDWPVVVLLGAMIPVGEALQSSGATQLVATGLLAAVAASAPALALALILVLTMTLSDVINNAATAVVMAPIATSLAAQLGVAADPFLMAVAIGASCAFLTPIGHQNNMLIMGPAGYHFGDYWRMGLPLEILIVAVAVPLLLVVWPL